MPAVRRLPDDATMLRHVKDGWTNSQVADHYGVTNEAVRQRLAKLGIRRGPEQLDHSHYIPWRVRAPHWSDATLKYLRGYSALKQGKTLRAEQLRQVQRWMKYMDGDNPAGVPLSVHYDGNDEEGFWLEPRQVGDRDYISPPVTGRAKLRSVRG